MKVIANPKLPIKRGGIYSGISLETYHSPQCTDGASVSSSDLRAAWPERGSMKHMYCHWAHNPKRAPRKQTEWMRFGRMAHHLLLGEEDFQTQYIMHPRTYRDKTTAIEKPWHMGADYCKQWVASAEASGRTVVKPAEIDKIMPMVASLRLEPLVQADVLRGLVEHSIIVRDEETGLWLKTRPDVIPNDGDYVDVKITSNVTDYSIMRSIRDFGYHMQGALMWEVCDQLKLPFNSFTLLLIENEEPFCVRAVPLTDEDLSLGRLQCRAMIRQTAICLANGVWPGPGEGDLRPLPLPTAERESIQTRLQYLSR